MNTAKAYHLTPTRNLKYIETEGLLARKGRRSRDAHEPENGVWMFPNINALLYGIDNWITNMFSDRTRLALLEVDVNGEALLGEHIEVCCPFDIRRSQIRVITRDINTITENDLVALLSSEG
jgi:hypothetical protein